jgi:hypothetical protein
MSNENKNAKINKIKEYANIPASGIFLAYTIIQTILFCVWFAKEAAFIVRTAGMMSLVKESVIILLIFGCMFLSVKNISDLVVKNKLKPYYHIVLALFITTSPLVVSMVVASTVFAVSIIFIMMLLYFCNRYFYGNHEKRLYHIIGVFALLFMLQIVNRAAFWCGEAITFLFLTIQLIRNIITKRKNISDKSWRNTLLLFCILIIIVLIPQYCNYNNIHHTLYYQSLREQLAARFIVPFVESEKVDGNYEYLLGVIEKDDYAYERSYNSFKEIIHRYEEDNLDMDEIWDNLYRNMHYRYFKIAVDRYLKDSTRNLFSAFLIKKEANSIELNSHHGYYYGLFQNASPKLSSIYMTFGIIGICVVSAAAFIQAIIICVIDLITGKMKSRIASGNHPKIEAVLLILTATITWNFIQTLFSLTGTSYIIGAGALIICYSLIPILWLRNKEII